MLLLLQALLFSSTLASSSARNASACELPVRARASTVAHCTTQPSNTLLLNVPVVTTSFDLPVRSRATVDHSATQSSNVVLLSGLAPQPTSSYELPARGRVPTVAHSTTQPSAPIFLTAPPVVTYRSSSTADGFFGAGPVTIDPGFNVDWAFTDLLIATVASTPNVFVTPVDAGWKPLTGAVVGTTRVNHYWAFVQDVPNATFQWFGSAGGNEVQVIVDAYYNTDLVNPFNNTSVLIGSGLTVTAPSLVASVSNCLSRATWVVDSSSGELIGFSNSNGFTVRVLTDSGDLATGDKQLQAGVPSGNATAAVLDSGVGFQFAIQPPQPPTPVRPFDWPNPRGKQYPSDIRGFVQSTNLLVAIVPATVPTYDWPVPKGKQFPSDLRTYLDPLDLSLLGQDQLFGTAGQPLANYDWPVPKGRQYPADLRTFVESINLNLVSQDQFEEGAGQPTPIYDWPVPKGRIPGIDLKTWIKPVQLELLSQDQFFGAAGQPVPNYDWPVPKGRQHPSDLRTYTQSVDLSIVLAPPPFFNYDFPVPKGKQSYDLRGYAASINLNLLGADQFEEAPGEPTPNYDWPVPKGRQYPSDLRTFTGQINKNLIGQDQFYGTAVANYDWPVPKGRQYPSDLRTFIGQVNLNLLSKDTIYGVAGEGVPQYDWPVPKGRIPAIELKTWINPVRLALIGQDTFFGANGEPAPNYDQPIPYKHVATTQTRTAIALQSESGVYSDRLTNLLQGQDTFFGAPGQPLAFEPPPNPIGKPYPLALRINDPQRFPALPVTGPQTVFPTGIPSAEAIGTPKIIMYLKPTGIPSQEAVGAPTLFYGLLVLPTGISSSEAVGTPKVSFVIHPSGIAGSGTVGTPKVNFIIRPTGIPSQEFVGAPHVYVAALQTVLPTGIPSGSSVGTPHLIYNQFVKPTGIPSGSLVGTPHMKQTGLAANHLALAMNAIYLCKIKFGVNTERILLATVALSEIGLALSFASPDDPISLLYDIERDVKFALECMFNRGFGAGEDTTEYDIETERIHIERAYDNSHSYLLLIGFIKS